MLRVLFRLLGSPYYLVILLLSLSQPSVMAAELFIDNPAALSLLEEKGLRASGFFHQGDIAETDKTLAQNPAYRFIVERMAREMGDFQLEERARVQDSIWQYAESLNPNLFVENSRLELVGLALRPDRKLFQIHGCGEIRLIYRLSATDRKPKYRYPISAILELPLPQEENCQDSWRRYASAFASENVDQMARDVLALAKSKSYLWRWNVQFLRVPQRNKSPDLSRNAYLLRSFRINSDGKASIIKLENTIDVPRMTEAMKRSLWQWVVSNRPAIDRGVFIIPEEFLADKAIVTTPYSAFRVSNFPLDKLFEDASFDLGTADPSWDKARTLRQLGSASCQGCHGIRSVAGFHFLGLNEERSVYTVKYAYSNHFWDQQAYRQKFLDDKFFPQYFPSPDRAINAKGDDGDHCGLDSSFAAWTCKSALLCSGDYPRRKNAKIGVCIPGANWGAPGDSCDKETIETEHFASLDRVKATETLACKARKCAKSVNGFPGGYCMSTCQDQAHFPDTECITGVRAKDFSPCLRQGRSIEDCRRISAQQTLYKSCNAARLCRDDYVCMQIENRPNGACVPPYVLEEMTLLSR